MDRTKESALSGEGHGAEPEEDGLAAVIRATLRALTADIEPPPAIWDLIRQRVKASAPSIQIFESKDAELTTSLRALISVNKGGK